MGLCVFNSQLLIVRTLGLLLCRERISPLDADDEDIPVCCCDSPCMNAGAKGWFCPSRLSVARKCPGSRKTFQYPKGQSVSLEWFARRQRVNVFSSGSSLCSALKRDHELYLTSCQQQKINAISRGSFVCSAE